MNGKSKRGKDEDHKEMEDEEQKTSIVHNKVSSLMIRKLVTG